MPATSTVFPALELRLVHISGTVSVSEIKDLSSAFFRTGDYKTVKRQLVDLTEFVDTDTSFSNIMALRDDAIQAYASEGPPVRVAIAAPGDTAFGMAKMYQSGVGGHGIMDIEIFPTLDEAITWLGGPFPPEIEALRHS